MKVGQLIEQLLDYDLELPVRISKLTEMNGHQYHVDSELIEISRLLLCDEVSRKTKTLIIGYKGDEFPEYFE